MLFYYRYVDDIILAVHKEIDLILDMFNSYYNRIKFIVEHYGHNGVIFLDVKLIIEDGKIIFNMFKKPINSDKYFNFNSIQFIIKKMLSLVNLTLYLSHPKFQEKNIHRLIEILINNCYPLDIIFVIIINNRKKTLFYRFNTKK